MTAVDALCQHHPHLHRLLLQADPDLCHRGTLAFFVPGRIEVLGKHTDYAGGRSITCALDRGFAIIARPRTDRILSLQNANTGENTRFIIDRSLPPILGEWTNYPMTVARRLAMNFEMEWRGADVAFASDLPMAAGLSSSSALIVGIFFVLAAVNALRTHASFRENITNEFEMAEYCGCIENGRDYKALKGTAGVGTRGGSEDHVAILCSTKGHLTCYAYQPVQRIRSAPMPAGCGFVVACSGVKAEKTGDALARYNRLADLSASLFGAARPDDLSPEQRQRLSHLKIEDGVLLPAALAALDSNDLDTFAAILNSSHDLADRYLDNQTPETNALVRLARERGAVASSAFGAGFGGSVYAIVPMNHVMPFLESWRMRYHGEFPARESTSEFFVAYPAASAIPFESNDLSQGTSP